MNLKEWRESKDYSLQDVAYMVDKKSAQTILNWETNGIKRDSEKVKLKRISEGKIKDFSGGGLPEVPEHWQPKED